MKNTRSSRTFPEFDGLSLVSGHSGLDFLNTIKYRGEVDDGDRLSLFSDIASWACIAGIVDENEHELLSTADDRAADIMRLHREMCKFREQARIVIGQAQYDATKFEKAALYVERTISKFRPTARIDRQTGALKNSVLIKMPQDLKFRIVACIAELLENRSQVAIKSCNGHDCDWVFIDRTKAKRRQWCDTRTCGNIARVRRHRASRTP